MIDVDLMLDDLRTLVDIESPSRDHVALATCAGALAAMIEQRTGRSPRLVETTGGQAVHWSGGGEPQALVLGHYDTVFPIGTVAGRPFRVADGRATGPGVFDMKGGIVQAIHAIASLSDRGGIEMLWTPDEEVGSRASIELVEQRAAACGAVLVLEPSADGGALKTARKGLGTFEVVIHGRAAHAGLELHKGANALVEAARQVLVIDTFGDAARGTTVTPTVAHVGTADNVVPALANLLVDVRIETADEQQRVEEAMSNLRSVDPRTHLEVGGGFNRPPMPATASSWLFPLARSVALAHGWSGIEGVAVGGGSDGNFTAACGVPTLDGLGAVGGGAHSEHEHLVVAEMPVRALLLAGILAELQAR